MRVGRVLFQRDAESPFGDSGLVVLEGEVPNRLRHRARIIGRLSVSEAALGLGRGIELFQSAVDVAA